MAALRSLLFLLVFYGGTLPFVAAALLSLPFGRAALRSVANGWALFHSHCARNILGIGVRVEGPVPESGVLIAAKHESMFETMEMAVLFRDPAVVMKRELARIPIWGWLAQRYGMIPIDREGGAGALRRLLKLAGETAAQGRVIVIFPEGTRVPHGEAPPLQPGFAGLYRALGRPIVPLALDSGRFWGRHLLGKRPGIVTFRFGEPIPPGLPRREAEARVHEAINALQA